MPSPCTRLTTPVGSSASWASATSRCAVNEASGDGFSTTVQPATSTGASFHTGMASGKFHSVMSPTTPIACRVVELRVRAVGRQRPAAGPSAETGGELDDLDRLDDLRVRLCLGLAVLLVDQQGQFGPVPLHQPGQAMDQVRAPDGPQLPPTG